MLQTDINAVIQWWFILFLLGIGFLPLTFFLFKTFFDKGYLFSKMLGLTITTYIIFVLGLLHVTRFTQQESFITFFITVCVFFFVLRKQQKVFQIIKQQWKTFLIEELFFIAALFFWAYIHSFSADVHGLEKYMDFGFINSILRADYFPPKDMWFTPLFINYYYFGHLMTAVLTKLSNLPSSITFNLMLSTIFAFCFTQSFSIAANLYSFIDDKIKFFKIKRLIAGLLSASLLTLGGNLHILYGFFQAYPNETPVPIWQLPFLPFSFPNGYWYPNATRFIHNTIHEFPIYSWTVADLHGHVLDIPVVLLTIALLLSFFKKSQLPNHKPQTNSKKQISKKSHTFVFKLLNLPVLRNFSNMGELVYLLPIGFLLAVMYMTNAWDGAIYFLLASFVIFYLYSRKRTNYKVIFSSLLVILVSFIVFVLPYNYYFKPFVSGIGILCSPGLLIAYHKIGPFLFEADHCQHSPWWQLLTLYGFFYFFVISFLVFIKKMKKLLLVDQFIFLLIILATLLIIIPEFIYVKDIYPAHYRANTMFKLVFQAFMMLSLVSGFTIVRIVSALKRKLVALCFMLVSIILVSIVMLYPYQAVMSYYGNLQVYHGLDGTSYLDVSYPEDAAAIKWLNENVKGQPVILEAQGDSYTDYARVSSNTGLPTILGWTVHEWLWRGTYDIPAPRIAEVKTMYKSNDLRATKTLLEKYKVQYIFIGSKEHEKYLDLNEKKFTQLGKLVFARNNTKIYKMTTSH